MKRKLKITVTKLQRRTATTRGAIFSARCPICEIKVEILSVAEAAAILEIDDQKLAEMIAANRVHGIETASGSLWICKDSLFKPARN